MVTSVRSPQEMATRFSGQRHSITARNQPRRHPLNSARTLKDKFSERKQTAISGSEMRGAEMMSSPEMTNPLMISANMGNGLQVLSNDTPSHLNSG